MESMRDLLALAAQGQRSIEELKALPIAYVLEQKGLLLEQKGTGYATMCPFHDDHDPSLDVYGEKLERFGCFSCGAQGDVLDLIGRLYGLDSFGDIARQANELLDQLVLDEWTGPTVGVTRTLDMDRVRQRVNFAGIAVTHARQMFLDEKRETNPGLAPISADWLKEVFGIGEEGDSIVIPYWNRDLSLITLKHRTASTKALSAPGSSFADVLYGEWRDTDTSRTVVLCEGESDVWAATHALWSEPGYVVLGLPTGAGSHPKQASRLAGRTVILAFDGDEAGRRATSRWHKALTDEGAAVSIVSMPDGYDIAGLGPAMIRDMVTRSRSAPAMPTGLWQDANGYYRPTKEDRIPVSNWWFDPQRELISETGMAYEGLLQPMGIDTTITSADLSSKPRIVAWSAKHGAAWFGSDRDAQLLLGMLQAAGPFLGTGKLATVAGLHDRHFIWPGGRIGPDYWRYSSPGANVHLEERMWIEPGNWSINQIGWLRALHDATVMDPLLSWLALAPVRSLLREFPILAVTGSSGSGKTTLLEVLLPAFTGTLITNNLTSTTRHALFAYVGATNAFPVHFDEYRPGARKDALETLDQLIRDAYTSQASSKGGMGEHWAEVQSVRASTPLIVSGEDAFSETSHTERMVQVHLPLAGRSPEALEEVRSWGRTGLAHAYLSWLQEGLENGTLRQLTTTPSTRYPELAPRQQINMGILELGWELLNDFLVAHGGAHLGEPNFSLPAAEAQESRSHNPILDAILWALDEVDSSDFLVQREGTVYIRIENLVEYVTRRSSFKLPGGPEAVRRYLVQHFLAAPVRVSMGGKQVRAYAMSAAALGL